jgi:hypothetical protein
MPERPAKHLIGESKKIRFISFSREHVSGQISPEKKEE